MIKRRVFRSIIWFSTLLCATGDVAIGPCSGSTGTAPIVGNETGRSTDSDSPLLTLEELKATGALRSGYRRQQQRPVGPEAPKPDLAAFRKDIQPVLEKSCVQCHGPETQEGSNSRSLTWDASYSARFNGELLEVHQVWDVVRSREVDRGSRPCGNGANRRWFALCARTACC